MAGSRTLGAVALLAASLASGLHAAWGVRRMRVRAAGVSPLDHALDLPGRFPPRSVVMLGDSAAAGHGLESADEAVPRRVARALVAVDGRATAVRSVAVDGATTDDVLRTQVDAARGADVVLLGVGANDAFRAVRSFAEVADTTHRLLTAIREVAAPNAHIVFHTCPDLSMAPALPVVLRPAVGWRCRRVAEAQHAVAAMHGVPFADMPREHLSPEVFGADRFHPGLVGHARLAERVVTILTDGPAGTAAPS
ncbi:MAG: SGNH/GDSL hydrolase family protein [Nitriliruptoraceae bacterium]